MPGRRDAFWRPGVEGALPLSLPMPLLEARIGGWIGGWIAGRRQMTRNKMFALSLKVAAK